jgi:hypothetical protein
MDLRDDGLLDSLAELGLGDLLHLGQDHGRDFLGRERLSLAEVVDLDRGRSLSVDNGKWPVLSCQLQTYQLGRVSLPSCPS